MFTLIHRPLNYGKLFLLPVPLGADALETIPPYVVARIHALDYFVAERAKTARRFIKSTGPERPISELNILELNKRTTDEERSHLLDAALNGHDVGLLSEAGCPAVADPGAQVVAQAHRLGVEVVPLVGPSSILLAIMGSGMNGQGFTFHGYLAAKPHELTRDLRRIEQDLRRTGYTQLCIETPYRNDKFIETALQTLHPTTRFGIATDLTLSTEYVKTKTIADWKKSNPPSLHKRPTIFLLGK